MVSITGLAWKPNQANVQASASRKSQNVWNTDSEGLSIAPSKIAIFKKPVFRG